MLVLAERADRLQFQALPTLHHPPPERLIRELPVLAFQHLWL